MPFQWGTKRTTKTVPTFRGRIHRGVQHDQLQGVAALHKAEGICLWGSLGRGILSAASVVKAAPAAVLLETYAYFTYYHLQAMSLTSYHTGIHNRIILVTATPCVLLFGKLTPLSALSG